MPNDNNPESYTTPPLLQAVRRGAYTALGALALVFSSGALDWNSQPDRPTQQCWDTLAERLESPAPQPHLPVPEALSSTDQLLPEKPEPNGMVNTAALELKLSEFSLRPSSEAKIGNFRNIQQFESLGGLQITIRRDQDLPIDAEEFNNIFEDILTSEYPDVHMQAHMWCYYDDLVSGKFKDKEMVIRIPASPQVCYGGMRLMVKEQSDDCNSSGATFPNPSIFGVWQNNRSFITATASALPGTDPTEAQRKITRSIMHELTYHGYYSLLGEPFPFTLNGWDYDEQYAKENLNPFIHRYVQENVTGDTRLIPFEND